MMQSPLGSPDSARHVIRNPPEEDTMLLAANGVWVWTILAIIIWIAIAFWPARVAARKGHSFFLYFLFSLVFFPAALIVAYLVHDRSRPAMA
jgi:hypothetical protein